MIISNNNNYKEACFDVIYALFAFLLFSQVRKYLTSVHKKK